MNPAVESFRPIGDLVLLTTSTVTSQVALPDRNQNENRQLQIGNNSTSWLFIKFGSSSAVTVASKTGTFVAPGAVVNITINDNITNVAGILLAGAGEAYINIGEGL